MATAATQRRGSVTRAAIYVRISRDAAGEGLGVERQEADCRALIERNAWQVAEVYSDNDTSASRYAKRGRAAYARLLADVEAGRVDAVVAYRLDRLYRRPSELEEFIAIADRHGTALATVTGDYDLSASEGRLRARMLGAVAAHEAEATSERIRRAIRANVEAGKPTGGGRAYGYTNNRIVAEEAEVIRELVGRVLKGETIRSLALDLRRRDVATPRGGAWRPSTLRRMLLHPRIAGLREHHGAITGPAAWEAIITAAQHRQLVAVLGPPIPRGKRPPRTHPLTGLIHCGVCGRRMTARPSGRVRRYVCSPGNLGCGRIAVAADPVERIVFDRVLLTLAWASSPRQQPPTPDVAADLDEIEDIEGRLSDLGAQFGSGVIAMEAFVAAQTALRGRLDAARERVAEKTAASATEPLPDLTVAELEQAWAGMDIDKKVAYIRDVIGRITVKPAVNRGGRFDPSRLAIRHIPGRLTVD